MTISVITASLPTRGDKLAQCIASVTAQTLRPMEHLVGIDHSRYGSSATRNALLAGVRGERTAILDDDDLMYPNHLETLAASEADIAYSYCDVEGRDWRPNQMFDPKRLREGNYIPATALVRTSLLRELEGWRDISQCQGGLEDWDLWRRALDAGASFECIPVVTWCYRFHGGNKTDRGEGAAL